MKRWLGACLLSIAVSGASLAQTPYPDYRGPLPELDYLTQWFAEADYDPAIATPEALLGFPLGQQAATPAQIAMAVSTWAAGSERARIVEYARSYEGRPLHYLVISSAANLSRQADIQAGMSQLADPRNSTPEQRQRLVDELPAVGWFAYSIHGNESSGADAALAVIHHLLADRSQATQTLLDEVVIIIDPSMNPDGRQRFAQDVVRYRSQQANVDDQSLVHSGSWPYGRGNHYLFDLNRDWIYGVHPETRGRIRAVREWNPIMFIDGHEMGSQDSYLFSPARRPHNPHFPPYRYSLGAELADDMAAAFDEYGYPYYSGEWHEDWYPGYSDSWAALRGAQGILYEQARIADDGVQQLTQLISYPQSVHHQVIATMANLESLRQRRASMLRTFAEDRATVASEDGPYGERHYVLLPGDNHGRAAVLKDLLDLQGFEAFQLNSALTLRRVGNQMGEQQRDLVVPAGSIFLPGHQPNARLLAAMFDFDPRISDQALRKERESLLRDGASTLYDATAWNVSMMFGMPAYQTSRAPAQDQLSPLSDLSSQVTVLAEDAVAYAVNGVDDRAPALAARLSQRGLTVRVSDRESVFGGQRLPRGSVLVTGDDHRRHDAWRDILREEAQALSIDVMGLKSGRADSAEAPDLGGGHFPVAVRPRVAIVGGNGTDIYDFGSLWFVLDRRLGLRHSHLPIDRLSSADLRRYNVLVLPGRRAGTIPDDVLERLKSWVNAGGTLIATGNSAAALAEQDWLDTATLAQVLDDVAGYSQALAREWAAKATTLPEQAVLWGRTAAGDQAKPAWAGISDPPSSDTLHRHDAWQSLFMPSGAMVAARVDQEHWLTAGSDAVLPVLTGRSTVLHARLPAEVPVRLGVYRTQADNDWRREGWVPVPQGQALLMRMSGLLWPEARTRMASAAWLTRQSIGNGQVVLFANSPAFRAAAIGTARLFENAVVFGPGLGARPAIELP
jgi:hypothetical protein